MTTRALAEGQPNTKEIPIDAYGAFSITDGENFAVLKDGKGRYRLLKVKIPAYGGARFGVMSYLQKMGIDEIKPDNFSLLGGKRLVRDDQDVREVLMGLEVTPQAFNDLLNTFNLESFHKTGVMNLPAGAFVDSQEHVAVVAHALHVLDRNPIYINANSMTEAIGNTGYVQRVPWNVTSSF